MDQNEPHNFNLPDNMSTNSFISKAKINDRNVYLQLQWINHQNIGSDLFELRILDGDCSWIGTFSNDSAEKYISKLYQSRDQYLENAKQCLMGEYTTEYKLKLTVEVDGLKARFCWQKQYEGFLQDQGVMEMCKDPSGSKNTLIDLLIDKSRELNCIISELNKNKEEMNSIIEKYKTDLEKFSDMKLTLENDLYSKFVELLNTKKHRIRLLEDQLKNYMD